MYHGAHRFRAFHTKRHIVVSASLIALSALALLVGGYFINVPWGEIGTVLALSFERLFASYAISLVVGASLALALGATRFGDRLLPVFDVLQNIPSFALIPLFIAAFGFGSSMIILFSATSIIWPIMFYVASAILGAEQELSDAARVFGATGWKRIVYYLIPLSFPALVTGSVVGIAIGWEAIIGSEIIVNARGIGSLLNVAGEEGNTKLVAVGILSLLLVVFIISRLVWLPLLKSARHYSEP